MSKRIVFGRRYVGDDVYGHKIEMRTDGIYIRRKYSRQVWHVPFSWLLKYCCNPQLELFNEGMDKGNPGTALPDLQQGHVVPDRGESGALHESPERPAQAVVERGDGLAARIKCDHKFIDSNTCIKCGWNPEDTDPGELSEADERLDAGHTPPDGGLPG